MIRLFRAANRIFGLTAIALSLWALGACQPTVKTADDFHQAGIIAIQKDDLATALENLDQAVALESSNPTMLVNRGLVYDELGEYEDAISDYTAAIALDETLSTAYYNRANAHHNLGQFEAAVADYSKAIEQQADFAYAYVNRAINLEVVGEKEKAIADLTRAVEIFKQNGDTEDVERVTAKIELLKQSSAINQ
ncbi:MAG: hypothetical protein DCF25_17315 [Leptolyngbya foveolarum]|uniref:Uncharacterized protein n=1 Tax=Leptolyngbya foveolarum TaxID=47253 RepID=A0A2W4TU69_9CYAN|nr:MAG: hypothetical protein DCF25_17315 [Leptolyngbya foveolarum]